MNRDCIRSLLPFSVGGSLGQFFTLVGHWANTLFIKGAQKGWMLYIPLGFCFLFCK